jgi:hypothetical protein
MHISAALAPSPGEQFRTSAIGYTGVAGTAGLGWDVNFTTGAVALGSANRAWDIGTFFAQDTLQPFADNAGVFTGVGGTGLNPNFGYAGIWADPARGDALGLFLDSGSAPGSSIIVAFDVVSAPPLAIPGVDGNLCLSLATLSILFPPPAFVTTAPPAGAGSIATIGPFPLAGFAGFGNAYLQAATIDAVTGAIRLSTLARVNL